MLRITALRQAFRATHLAAAGAAGAVVLEATNNDVVAANARISSPTTLDGTASRFAESEQSSQTALLRAADKPSIYPNPEPPVFWLDTPSTLEVRIGQVREELCGYYKGASAQLQGIIHRWISIESKVESRIKSFRHPAEPLNPGLLYTGLSALTVSIFVRSRSVPTRILLPPLSFLGAFAYFLPLTANRISKYAEELEGSYVPKVAEVRRTGVAHAVTALKRLHESTEQRSATFSKGARVVVDTIATTTGLKLNDATGFKEEPKDKTST